MLVSQASSKPRNRLFGCCCCFTLYCVPKRTVQFRFIMFVFVHAHVYFFMNTHTHIRRYICTYILRCRYKRLCTKSAATCHLPYWLRQTASCTHSIYPCVRGERFSGLNRKSGSDLLHSSI